MVARLSGPMGLSNLLRKGEDKIILALSVCGRTIGVSPRKCSIRNLNVVMQHGKHVEGHARYLRTLSKNEQEDYHQAHACSKKYCNVK